MSVGERLMKRRQDLSWTQVQLAEAAALTPSAISLFESNKRKPSFEALRKLAEALQVSVDYLTDDQERPQTSAPFDPRVDQIIQGFHLLDEVGKDHLGEYLVQLLARRAGGFQSFATTMAPRQAALNLLDKLGLRFAPIDPFMIATVLGITIRMASFTDENFEAVLEQRVNPPLMLLARHEKLLDTRVRYTVAHQLAHFVLEHHRQGRYECRSMFASERLNMAEQEANEFAAELLVPRTILEKLEPDLREGKRPHPSADQALSVANRFRTSIPVTFLQYAHHSPLPCACLFTQGGRVREVAVSASFPHLLQNHLPEQALCRTTMDKRGVQRRDCAGSEWLTNAGTDELLVIEEAFHYNQTAEQSVTLLSMNR